MKSYGLSITLVAIILTILGFVQLETISGLPVRIINGNSYVLAPIGLVPIQCVTELPENGAHVRPSEEDENQMIVDIYSPEYPDQIIDSYKIPPCTEKFPVSEEELYAQSNKAAFPSDYDGWLAYTSYDNSGVSLDSFLGNFSVPDTPASTPAVLYVFTGLQNVNWIPKVDPIPIVFDIIQPVLQYPGDLGNYWSVKSWYVTVRSGVQVTKELKLNVGDTVFGNMTRTGPQSWFIGSQSVETKKSVGLTTTHKTLASQPWAYTTVECYGCEGCGTEPTQSIDFTEMILTQGSQIVSPNWTAFQSPNPICDTTANIMSPETVTFTFGQSD